MAETKGKKKKGKTVKTKGVSSSGKKGIKDRLKAVDRELAAIEGELVADTTSKMFAGGASSDLKLVHMREGGDSGDGMRGYYKSMVLRCMKCNERFSHEATVSQIEHELTCPACGESHLMRFKPSSKFFTVHSKTVDVVKHED